MSAGRATVSVSEGPFPPENQTSWYGVQRWTVNGSTRPYARWQRASLDAEHSARQQAQRVRFLLPLCPFTRGRASIAPTSAAVAPQARSTRATMGWSAAPPRQARQVAPVSARSRVTVAAHAWEAAAHVARRATGATTARRVVLAGAAIWEPAPDALILPGRWPHGFREV